MSYKAALIKFAIRTTPNFLIIWGANIALRGVAKLMDFKFDLDARKVYVQARLAGEADAIEVWLEDFSVVGDEKPYRFIVQEAKSNRIWLDNLLGRIVRKPLKIPDVPQLASHLALVSELLKPRDFGQKVS
jgi:hypothetical protein